MNQALELSLYVGLDLCKYFNRWAPATQGPQEVIKGPQSRGPGLQGCPFSISYISDSGEFIKEIKMKVSALEVLKHVIFASILLCFFFKYDLAGAWVILCKFKQR